MVISYTLRTGTREVIGNHGQSSKRVTDIPESLKKFNLDTRPGGHEGRKERKMEELKIFENQEFGQIRTLVIDNEPWFVGKDVAERLGYSNPSKAVIVHVDNEDKCFEMFQVSDSQNGNLVKTAIINESGLYSLIFGSNLESAKRFKRWVTSEVLHAIRKTGSYSLDKQEIAKQLANSKTAAGVKAILSLYGIQPQANPTIIEQNSVTAYLGNVEDWEITDIPSKKVYTDYCTFCNENDYSPMSLCNFSRRMRTDAGYVVKRIRFNGALVGFYRRE